MMQATPPRRLFTWVGQFLLYGAFAGAIALFSHWPSYRQIESDQALIKLSIVHDGQRIAACRALSAKELQALPPNMRSPTLCPRERAPLLVELDIDGHLAHRQLARPSGLSRDGSASLYHRQPVHAGSHLVSVRLRDTARSAGFDYQRQARVELRPGQILVIDFDSTAREIQLK
jgi:hypothetical protein